MTDIYNSKGWKNRRRAAEARRDEQQDEVLLAVRAERARLYQAEQDANEAALQAQRLALDAERCACPACAGTGRVEVVAAAGLLDAWFRYKFSERAPSQATVAALAALARGDAPPPGSPVVSASYGFTLPAPDMVRHVETVVTLEKPATKIMKPAKVDPPIEDTTGLLTSDGYLIEV